MPLRQYLKNRVGLFVAAAGVSIIALVLIWASVVFVPQRYVDGVSSQWARFGFVTIIFTAYWLRMYWKARRQLRFWLVLAGIMIVHFTAVGYIFYRNAGLLLLVITIAAETALLGFAVYHFLGIGPPLRKH